MGTQCSSSSALSVPWAGRSVVKQDLTALPTTYVTVGLNFLICKMGLLTISTSRAVEKSKGKVPSVVPGVC